jgi:hypothetical protein
MALIRAMFTLLVAAVLWAAPLQAESGRRVALVIGNSTYLSFPVLANPSNDATDIARKLQGLGFEVILGTDLDGNAFQAVLLKFAREIEGAEASLLFYAGHGIQIDDTNYLIPIDARLAQGSDVTGQAVPIDRIVGLMNEYTQTSIVLLDACRNNPLANAGAAAAGPDGLARIRAEGGSYIAFATAPGTAAFDGTGRNSPFSEALLRHIDTPNVDIRLMMSDVRQDVFQATDRSQLPWENNSLIGRFYFRQDDNLERLDASQRTEAEAWKAIANTTAREDFAAFLRDFPDGAFASVAQLKIAALDQLDQRDSAEREDFVKARATNSEAGWKAFIDTHKGSLFAELASEQLEKLRAEIAESQLSLEEIHWQSVETSRSPGDFRTFLSLYPDGSFADLATERLTAAERAQEIAETFIGEPTSDDARSARLEIEVKRKVDQVPTQFIQYGLVALGHPIAEVTGVIDAPTRKAIRNYQATIGVEQTGRLSPQEVVDLIMAAAALGDSYAMTAVGIMTAQGQGLQENPSVARLWFDRAADKGNGLAMANLGILYRDGRGGSRDLPKARSLLTVAVTLGVEGAEPLLRSLETEGNP